MQYLKIYKVGNGFIVEKENNATIYATNPSVFEKVGNEDGTDLAGFITKWAEKPEENLEDN